VKQLLRLFSGLKAGQLEISLSKKDNIYVWKSHYRQNNFLTLWRPAAFGDFPKENA